MQTKILAAAAAIAISASIPSSYAVETKEQPQLTENQITAKLNRQARAADTGWRQTRCSENSADGEQELGAREGDPKGHGHSGARQGKKAETTAVVITTRPGSRDSVSAISTPPRDDGRLVFSRAASLILAVAISAQVAAA